jgi:hypothetical protein
MREHEQEQPSYYRLSCAVFNFSLFNFEQTAFAQMTKLYLGY